MSIMSKYAFSLIVVYTFYTDEVLKLSSICCSISEDTDLSVAADTVQRIALYFQHIETPEYIQNH